MPETLEPRAEDLLVSAESLVKSYRKRGGSPARSDDRIIPVRDVSLRVSRKETLGIVGESGCGKSTLLRCLMGVERPDSGTLTFRDQDISDGRNRSLRELRRTVQWVPQNPYSSLDPRMVIRRIVAEPLVAQRVRGRLHERVSDVLESVGLPKSYAERYPHELSGGERQRISIARALVVSPKMLMLDEPVSALDVSVRAEVLNLLLDLRDTLDLSYVLVAHDLAVVMATCDVVAVMYAGRVVEYGPSQGVRSSPGHPYTRALLSAVPVPDPKLERGKERILLKGEPPSLSAWSSGCPFVARCPLYKTALDPERRKQCHTVSPSLTTRPTIPHKVACHFPEEVIRG